MAKIVSYKGTSYLLQYTGLVPILYIHVKKNVAVIRTANGLYLATLATMENRELAEAEKQFVDAYVKWFSSKNGEPHIALEMQKDDFDRLFSQIFS